MANAAGMTGVTRVPCIRSVAVLSETTHGHSDQAYTTKGESGQINVHGQIYRRRPSPWQDGKSKPRPKEK